MNARDLMTEAMYVVSPGDDLLSVGTHLYENRKTGAIVVEDDRVVGVLSKGGIALCVKQSCAREMPQLSVKDVMEKTYETIKPDEEFISVLRKFIDMPYRINRIPVVEDGRLLGEILKTGLVKVYAETMAGRFNVSQLMEYKPSFVYDYASLRDVIEEVYKSSDRKVIVMKGDQVAGIITILDIAIELFKGYAKGDCHLKLDEVMAEDFMSVELTTIKSDGDAATAAELMMEKHIGGVPVEGAGIEGIITKNDLIKGLKMVEEGVST